MPDHASHYLLRHARGRLSAIGIFAYTVSQRSQKIGIRLALGSSRNGVLQLMLKQAAWLILAGEVVGLGAACIVMQTFSQSSGWRAAS